MKKSKVGPGQHKNGNNYNDSAIIMYYLHVCMYIYHVSEGGGHQYSWLET